MLKRKKTKKNQKPIDYDIHLKYRCQNCDQDHWLSYLESSTKNFKIVCDCGTVFKIKRVIDFSIKYEQDIEKKIDPERSILVEKEESCIVGDSAEKSISQNIPETILQSATSILGSFGYSKTESFDMITQSYEKLKTDSVGDLVKFALANSK